MLYAFNFTGDINTKNTNTLRAYINSIKNLTPNDTLIININSFGGTVSEGIAIYNTIKKIPCNVITHNLGEVS